jgi:2-keto-4-pentenoate hydratase
MIARSLVVAGSMFAAMVSGAAAQSTCGEYDFATPFVASWLAVEEFAGAQDAVEKIKTVSDGGCHQQMVVEQLEKALGGRAGYKLAAVSALTQKQFGIDQPLVGVLFADGILKSGATVTAKDGIRPVVELDLAVRVASEAINEASTHEEALAAIDAFVPFIEISDLPVPRGVKVNGGLYQAMNVGARIGVAGDPVAVANDEAAIERLATLKASLRDGAGKLLVEGDGSALLGHPLDAVLRLANEAKARNWRIKEGDLLSLGSFGRVADFSPGQRLTAVYEGLGATAARVTVTLR